MLALVIVLTGSTVVSVQLTAVTHRSATAPTTDARIVVLIFMYSLDCWSSLTALEPEVQAAGPRARAWIDVVVDAIEPGRRIDATVARDREDILHRPVDTNRTAIQMHRVA